MATNRTEFQVVGKIANNVDVNHLVETSHWNNERKERHNKIKKIIGDGKLLASFEVYTAHRNGNEIHNIFDNGIIVIQNARTKFLVTELIARPQQIKRYWENLGIAFPIELYKVINKAKENQMKGYNNW